MGISTLWGERSEQAMDTAAVAGDSATLSQREELGGEWLPAPERK